MNSTNHQASGEELPKKKSPNYAARGAVAGAALVGGLVGISDNIGDKIDEFRNRPAESITQVDLHNSYFAVDGHQVSGDSIGFEISPDSKVIVEQDGKLTIESVDVTFGINEISGTTITTDTLYTTDVFEHDTLLSIARLEISRGNVFNSDGEPIESTDDNINRLQDEMYKLNGGDDIKPGDTLIVPKILP